MKKRVCIIEDDHDIRDLIGIILTDERYDVSLCSSARAFTNLIETMTPDVIVIDMMLTDGNGMEICRSLKATAATAGIPVLLMSAHSGIEDAMRESCAVDFISKPFDIDIFKNKVETWLQL
jgi:two-component system phosphate regulon response regulator PhoB